jgi:hypothetical protein
MKKLHHLFLLLALLSTSTLLKAADLQSILQATQRINRKAADPKGSVHALEQPNGINDCFDAPSSIPTPIISGLRIS